MPATLFPTMRYRDPAAMIDWLGRAFGFEKRVAYEDGGVVQHAELAFGDGMIMLGAARDDAYAKLVRPAQKGEPVTQSVYVVVKDVDAHHARAAAAGAEIVRPPNDTDYGSREYSCRDPEGQIWSFGTYDPWTAT